MISPCLYGHHTEFAYSKCGRTIDLYNNTTRVVHVYKISSNDTQDTICLIYFLSHMIFKCEISRLLSNITPKSFLWNSIFLEYVLCFHQLYDTECVDVLNNKTLFYTYRYSIVAAIYQTTSLQYSQELIRK